MVGQSSGRKGDAQGRSHGEAAWNESHFGEEASAWKDEKYIRDDKKTGNPIQIILYHTEND